MLRARALCTTVKTALAKAGLNFNVYVRELPWPVYSTPCATRGPGSGLPPKHRDIMNYQDRRLTAETVRDWDRILARIVLSWGRPKRAFDGKHKLEAQDATELAY